MTNSPDQRRPSKQDRILGGGLRDSVEVFSSHREARAHEIAQRAHLSPYERMVQFMELRERVWGTDNPDVRESGAVNVGRRET